MQAFVEKRNLAKQLWWRGLMAQVAGALLVALVTSIAPAVSFFGGGLALMLGNAASAIYAFRADAPTGTSAMFGVLAGTVLKWMVVAALLVLAMAAPGSRATWVFVGLLFAQVAMVVAVLTFKRR